MRERKPLPGSVELDDRSFGVGLIEDGFAVIHADQETIEADAVDLSGDPVTELVGGGDERIGERAAFHADDAQMMLDIGGRLFQCKRLEVAADVDALVEGFKALELEQIAQVGLAEEDEGERGGGIHIGVEPETELVEQAVAEQVSLIDDDEGMTAALEEVSEGVAKTLTEAARMEGWADVPGSEDVGKEGLDGEIGIGQVGGEVEIGVEGLDEGADGGGLA